MVTLSCKCQQYNWGKIGKESTVAQLVKNQPGFTVDETAPYAEVCVLPSTIISHLSYTVNPIFLMLNKTKLTYLHFTSK